MKTLIIALAILVMVSSLLIAVPCFAGNMILGPPADDGPGAVLGPPIYDPPTVAPASVSVPEPSTLAFLLLILALGLLGGTKLCRTA